MAPLALVHGNPETAAVWDHLAPSLEAAGPGSGALSPPGFGAAMPPDFQVTPAGYRDWLIGELERFGEPADTAQLRWAAVNLPFTLVFDPLTEWDVICLKSYYFIL
jgi:hypothetical protein